MKVFKYLILFLITFISSNLYALTQYYIYGHESSTTTNSIESTCRAMVLIEQKNYPKYVVTFASVDYARTNCMLHVSEVNLNNAYRYIKKELSCPSATSKALKVPVNAGSYVCVSQCQYMLTACVDIPDEPGMSCNAISTGKECTGSTNSTGGTSTPPTTNSPGANANNDGSSTATNSASSNTTGTSTSNSTSTSTTTNNTTNNTSTTTTNTTTTTTVNNTTNTIIDLSSLENTIINTSKQIVDAINKIGDKIKDGSDTGSENGTDMTETNNKLDSIKTSIDDSNSWAKDGKDDTLPTGEPTALPEKTLDKKSFTESIFGTSSQCPANKTLSMAFMHKSFTKTFDFTEWCYYLGLLGQIILIGAYLHGANIVTRS